MNDYKEIEAKIEEERAKGAFVFLPSPILGIEDSFYMPIIEPVSLEEHDVYKATGKYRIHYSGLLKLANAAAFEWSAIDTCRTDGRTDPLYTSFRAVGGVRKADGRIYFHKAEDELDLVVIKEELTDQYTNSWDKIGTGKNDSWKKNGHTNKENFVNAMVRRDLIQKRKNKLKLCESGAKSRVIRFVLGLQSQYSNKHDVIGKPFIIVHYALNIKHPAIKEQLIADVAQSQTMIYGGVKDTGQIAYEPQNDDIIDVQAGEPEQEPAKQEEFEPQPQPEQDSRALDFENCGLDDQIRALQEMCKKKNENYQSYDEKTKKNGGVRGMDQAWRNNFFNYLNKGKK